MNTKYRMDTHVFWVLVVAVAVGVAFFVNYWLSRASMMPTSHALQLSSLTSFSCTSPGTNSPGNLNYGISVFTGSGTQYYTECGHLSDAGVWEHRNTCNGFVTIGAADSISAQDCTLTGVTADNKNITLTVKVPGVSSVNGNMRFYIDDAGSAYYARADHNFSGTNLYPNDVDLTAEQAITTAHQITWGTPTCGNNWCQMNETYSSCLSDCAPPTPEMCTYTLTRTDVNMSGVEYGTPRSFTYNLTQTSSTCTGTDNVSVSVMDASSNPVSWCVASPAPVPVTGLNGTASFAVTCTPTVANLGSPMLSVRATSTKTPALAISAPLGFSVIAPVVGGGTGSQTCYQNNTDRNYAWFPAGTAGPNWTAVASSFCQAMPGGSMAGAVYTCYRAADSTYKWLLFTDPIPATSWVRADGMCSSGGTALCYKNSVTNELNYDTYQLGGPWVVMATTACQGMNTGDLKKADGTILTWSQRTGGGAGPGATQQCYKNTTTGVYTWFPTGTAGSGYTAVTDSTLCGSGGGGTNSNWISKTWNFKDALTANSMILNRTDAEYTNYIAQVQAACLLINKSQMTWKPNAGSDAATNWQNFGIPDCSGTGGGIVGLGGPNVTLTQLFPGQYNNVKFSITVEDPDGIQEFSVKTASNSSLYGGSPGASGNVGSCTGANPMKSVSSGTVDINPADFPLQAWVKDCKGNGGSTMSFSVAAPGGTVTPPVAVNWVSTTWNFKDALTTNSMILNRTDAEYTKFIATVRAACLLINKSQMVWKPGAGDDTAANWQNFGIPDCSGTAVVPPGPDPLKSVCFKGPDGTYMWVTPTSMVESTWVAVADSFCSKGVVPPPIPGGACAPGTKCPENSWCNMGSRCYYPDSQITCTASWDARCPVGTTNCRPGDTQCIETGAYGSLDGWCMNAQECFTSTQKYCAPWDTDPTSPLDCGDKKYCSPNESNCIEPGGKGPIGGWCKNGYQCYLDDGSGIQCVVQKFPAPAMGTAMTPAASIAPMPPFRMECPADSSTCRPDDKNCIKPGSTGPSSGWCGDGAQRCNKKDGTIYCPKPGESCPSDTTLCPVNDTGCTEPGKYGPLNGWCISGGGMGGGGEAMVGSVMCFKNDNTGIYCDKINPTDPKAWETFKCQAGTSRCREDDKYCLEVGETCSVGTGCWCASGTPQYKDGRMKCGSMGEEWKEILPPPPDDKDKICVWNPDYNEVKQEFVRLEQMEKALKTMGQTETVRVPIRAKIETARKALEILLKMAGETGCGAKDKTRFSQELKKFRDEVMKELEESFREFGFTGDLKGLERELQGRLEHLAKDLARFEALGDTDALTFIGSLVPEYKALLEAVQKGGADLDSRALWKRLMTWDQKIGDFWASRHNEGNQEFLGKAITQMWENLRMARDKLAGKTDPSCEAAGAVIVKIDKMIGRADSLYKQRNIPEAGKLLDEARQAMEQWLGPAMWQCIGPKDGGFEFDFDLDLDDAFTNVGGMDDELIAEIANRVAEKVTAQISLIIDAQLKEATARIAALENVAQEKITQSLAALQAVGDEYRQVMAELKTTMVEKALTIEKLIQEAEVTLRTADRNRLYQVLETISTYNWCGRVGDDMRAEADAIILAFEAGTVRSADITAFEARVTEGTARNGEACYQAGVSRFRDCGTQEWYFPSFQTREDFEGLRDPQGNLTGYVEPGREALGAEAMLTIMRAADYRGIEGNCPVPAGTEGATHVPPWATCAFNVANMGEFVPPVPLGAFIPRQYVAEMMVNVVQDRRLDDVGFMMVPPAQATAILAPFSDIRTCDVPREVIATMVANGIMTGNPDGTWNCDGNLNRAELATILNRFGEAMEFYGEGTEVTTPTE